MNTFSLTNVLSGTLGTLPEIGTIIRGVATLATSKPDNFNSLGSLLEKQAKKYPNNPAILQDDKRYTYAELNQWANRYCHYFQSLGIQSGDSISIMIENRPETLAVALATIKLGAVACMINTAQRGEILTHSLTLVKSKLIVVGEELFEAVEEVRNELDSTTASKLHYVKDDDSKVLPTHFHDLDKAAEMCSTENPDSTKKVQLKQPCFYIFTSGTTGLPKASVMTHYRWFKSMAGMGMASMRLKSNDVLYISLPMYHNNALTVSLGAAFGNGAALALARKFSVSRFWDDVRHYDATAFCYIGELCRYLLNGDEKENDKDHKIRKIIGNGLRPEIWHDFKQRFGIKHINEFYGASECNLVFTNALNLDSTAGICPLSYQVIEYDINEDQPVRNAKGFMNPVSPGETGLLITEITERSPFDGYTDKDASNKKLFQDVLKKGDCYFNSGDLVINQGYRHVAFVDRLGDTFRWKGENVATTEVEAEANQFSQVDQSVAYGVLIPNTDGRAGMAALTLNCPISEFNGKAFAKHIQAKLPAYAIPLFVRLREQQEITGTFKYRKVELKEEAYHLDKTNEPVWVLLPGSEAYIPLDSNLENEINSGTIRL